MERLEQNVKECIETIKKIKKKLEQNNVQYIIVKNDILCKFTNGSKILNVNLINKSSISNNSNIKYCRLKDNTTTAKNNCTTYQDCPYNSNCYVSPSDCPLYGNNSNTGNPGSGETEDSGNTNNYVSGDYLFRIRPSDTYNGIVVHGIMIKGEHSDFKMLFDYGDNAPQEIYDVLRFIVS